MEHGAEYGAEAESCAAVPTPASALIDRVGPEEVLEEFWSGTDGVLMKSNRPCHALSGLGLPSIDQDVIDAHHGARDLQRAVDGLQLLVGQLNHARHLDALTILL